MTKKLTGLARSPWVQGTVLILFAALTRLYRLTHWPLAGDEFFTIQDSQVLAFKGKPLLFYLNHYLIEPWIGLDALGVRLLPVIFGIASIPLLFWAGRKLFGPPAGLFASLLALLNPWHLYLSQFARYYPLVFFFSILVIVAFFFAFRDDSVGWLIGGVVAATLAILSHASAGLVLGSIGFWVVASTVWEYAKEGRVSGFRTAVSGAIVAAVVVASVVYLVPVLVDWTRNIPAEYGFAGVVLFLSFGQWLTAGTSLFAVGGAAWLWTDGERGTATYLVSVVALPFLFLALGGYFFKASVPFLFPAAPAVFLLAAYFVHRIYRELRNTRFSAAVISGVVLLAGSATGATSFVSHYMDGSRPDFRSAASYLNRHVESDDAVVLTDRMRSLERYLDVDVETVGFDRSVQQMETAVAPDSLSSPREVWVTAWIKERAGFSGWALGSAEDWIRTNCVLRHVASRPRLDFRRNDVRVYRCGAT